MKILIKLIIFLFAQITIIFSLPDQGKFDLVINKERELFTVAKSLFAGSKIYVQITCDSDVPDGSDITIRWILSQTSCWEDYINFYENNIPVINESLQIKSVPVTEKCMNGGHIPLKEYKFTEITTKTNNNNNINNNNININSDNNNNNNNIESNIKNNIDKFSLPEVKKDEKSQVKKRADPGSITDNPVFTITKDGVYLFELHIEDDTAYRANVHIEMKGIYGYLSAADWPLLPFYGAMCLVYVIFGLIWLLVSFSQWRDLLRIQFWIGGVILLGMLEKATFYAEYQSINSSGISVRGAVLLAEWVSCAKRTLARMLVIIVSLGFGIVKPRLGPMLHRVVGTGSLYFVLACVESYLRVMHTKNDRSNQILVASIPLAVLDSAICWWIFTSLVQTTRTLRLRRNMVKLALYRHFTNTLIFAVIASIIFMLFSIKAHRLAQCLTDWKELWQDEAFWHILFSSLLLVIMILWRPTNNNQRYAFTPLLDNPEDEDDEDEEDQFVSDAFGVKMRGARNNSSPKITTNKTSTTEEDDLRWVEENIPTSIADATLPVLDSDEEIINTKFEVSKMQ